MSIGDGVMRHSVSVLCSDPSFVVPGSYCVYRRACIEAYNHTYIDMRGFPGEGVNLTVRVHVETLIDGESQSPDPVFITTNDSIMFDYAKPVVTATDPRPFNAFGGVTLTVEGYNFGEPGVESEVFVYIDDMPCEGLRWNQDNTGAHYNGVPYLTCVTGRYASVL